MTENPDIVRQRFKQHVFTSVCPTCGYGLGGAGYCFWCDHGCKNGCGPISLHTDAFCHYCGSVTFRCPGEGCKSRVHAREVKG